MVRSPCTVQRMRAGYDGAPRFGGAASADVVNDLWSGDGDCLRPRGGEDRGDRRVDIRLGGGVVADRDAHDGLAAPDGTAEPTRAVALYRGDHRAGAGVVVLL